MISCAVDLFATTSSVLYVVKIARLVFVPVHKHFEPDQRRTADR